MRIPDDLNNCRIRQLIEQFNAEEAYDEERTRRGEANLRSDF